MSDVTFSLLSRRRAGHEARQYQRKSSVAILASFASGRRQRTMRRASRQDGKVATGGRQERPG